MGPDNMVTLISSDGERFEIERSVAEESEAIRHILADTTDSDSPVPLMNVRASILEKVIKFCRFNVEIKARDGERISKTSDEVDPESLKGTNRTFCVGGVATVLQEKAFNKEFVKVKNGELFELILAANYLNIKNLLDITCQAVAEQLRGKTPQQIREEFSIENDFTPEEQEEVIRENQWAFQ